MAKTFTLNGKAFGPRGLVGKTESWGYSATGTTAGTAFLSHEVADNVGGGASTRQAWTLKSPILAEEDSACGCAGSVKRLSTTSIVFNTSNTSTTAERQAVLDELDDLIADTDFRAAFVANSFIG